MPSSPLVAHLRDALREDPHDHAVRLQLAGALLAEDPAEALDHARRVLAGRPDDELALRLAIEAAERAGMAVTADGYRRRLDGTTAGPDLYDDFLREVLAEDARLRVALDDVGGLSEAKRHLRERVLAPLRGADGRRAPDAGTPDVDRVADVARGDGGLLLYGPPGCGKTMLARALAGELGARFRSIGLHEVLDMRLGRSAVDLPGLFERARSAGPSVVFLDEVDALGQKRSHLAHADGPDLVAQLLTELGVIDRDGPAADRRPGANVIVLAATSAPWDLDPALRQPGALDQSLLIPPPDRDARSEILAHHLHRRHVAVDVDLGSIAEATIGRSGADLALVCEIAAQAALAESADARSVRAIADRHLLVAATAVPASTPAWFDAARNAALFANADGAYDELLTWWRSHPDG